MRSRWLFAAAAGAVALVTSSLSIPAHAQHVMHQSIAQQKAPAPATTTPRASKKSSAAEYTPNVRFRLRTELAEGKMAFVGVGGEIEGVVNPTLRVAQGDIVQIGLVNGDGIDDVVVGTSTGYVFFWENLGGGLSWTSAVTVFNTGSQVYNIGMGDAANAAYVGR